MARLTSALLCIMFALAMEACVAGLLRNRYSKGDASDNGLSVVARADNLRESSLVIFPLPFPIPEGASKHSMLSVEVEFHPSVPAYSLDAHGVSLAVSAHPDQAAVSLQGPHPCGQAYRSPELVLPAAPIELPNGRNTCISFTFPVPPPDPAVNFSITIGGLRLGTNTMRPIIITLQQANKIDTLAVP